MQLNESQKRAVSLFKGPCLVLAGPGSGKTFVITTRIKNLIEYYKVPAEKILVATFSRAAANEMKARFNNLMGDFAASTSSPTFGTFHSIFFMILKASYNYDAKSIISDNKKYDLIRSEVERLNIFYENETDFFQTLINEISQVKNNFESVSTFKPSFVSTDNFILLYNAYEKSLRELELIDYDDMMNLCYELLSSNPKILKYWQNHFSFILIDEFQDINPIQYEIMKLLAAPTFNLFVVGDDDQSIYGFRGSSPLIMKQFTKDFPTLEYVQLDINYRSAKQITALALKVISEDASRFKKVISNIKTNVDSILEINIYDNPEHEYKRIADSISTLINNGAIPSSIAILVRSSNNIPLLNDIFSQKNIPVYSKNKSFNIYNSFIASDIISYLKISYALVGKLPLSEAKLNDFVSIMNKPSRYISRDNVCLAAGHEQFDIQTFFPRLKHYYSSNSRLLLNISKFEKDLRFIGNMPLYAGIQYLVGAVKYSDFLKEVSKKNHKDIREYLSILEQIKESALDFYDINDWLEYISNYTESLCFLSKDKSECINILTMHASKGLEFETVFIPDVNEGVLPHNKCTTKEQIEEERRLFYVAITRAKNNLFISYVKNVRSKETLPSRFIKSLLLEKKTD